jgi:hypothetical protein
LPLLADGRGGVFSGHEEEASLNDLYGLVAETESGPKTRQRVESVLRHLAQGRDLAEGQGGLADAVVHPLGFVYVPLLRTPVQTLRLHIWPEGAKSERPNGTVVSPMHDHTWDLASYVICGELRNVVVTVTEDRLAPTHRVFEIHGDGAVDDIRATGTVVRVVGEAEDKVSVGQTYRMGSDLIHRTEPGAGVVATLVAARRTSKRVERALGPLELQGYRSERQVCPPRRVAAAAAAVLEALGDR